MDLLGLKIDDNKEIILNEVSMYLFDTSPKTSGGKKVFDLVEDYKYYYVDFLEYNIDLNKDNISWWKFNSILDGIFLKKDSVIGKVIEYRTWQKPSKNGKKEENEYNNFMAKMRKEYSLKNENNIDNNLRTLMDSVRAKERK